MHIMSPIGIFLFYWTNLAYSEDFDRVAYPLVELGWKIRIMKIEDGWNFIRTNMEWNGRKDGIMEWNEQWNMERSEGNGMEWTKMDGMDKWIMDGQGNRKTSF